MPFDSSLHALRFRVALEHHWISVPLSQIRVRDINGFQSRLTLAHARL